MDVARFVVDAVVLEGRSCRDVAASHGVSKSWVAQAGRPLPDRRLRRRRAALESSQDGCQQEFGAARGPHRSPPQGARISVAR